MQGVWTQSLEWRSHMPRGTVKKYEINIWDKNIENKNGKKKKKKKKKKWKKEEEKIIKIKILCPGPTYTN